MSGLGIGRQRHMHESYLSLMGKGVLCSKPFPGMEHKREGDFLTVPAFQEYTAQAKQQQKTVCLYIYICTHTYTYIKKYVY